MEQHPIPQDVTGFQFKLIGTMTVKQFGYVAFGAILAVITYYAPAPQLWIQILKFFLVPIFGLSGVIVAFVPIEGRPVDVMAANFFHALVSANQYIYVKKGRKFNFAQNTYTKIEPASKMTTKTTNQTKVKIENKKEQQLQTLLSSHFGAVKNTLDKKEMDFLKAVENESGAFIASTLQTKQKNTPLVQNPTPNSNPAPISQSQSQGLQETFLQQQLTMAKDQQNSHNKVLLLQEQIQDIHSQKEQVEHELLKLKNQLSSQKPAITPADSPPVPQTPQPNVTHVRSIPQNMTKSAGLTHVSDTPNVIVGIVKDARGNILSNVLVEVKDKDGNPVRAFKTNPLGQFASATPLTSGIYTIELEDPKKQHAFDVIQINADGQIMLPIEIISHDAREELRKALFN